MKSRNLIAKRAKRPLLERFNEKWCPEPFSGCWLWMAGMFRNKYGQIFTAEGEPGYAHRVSWELHRGEIPKGLCVLHKCDTRPCVNPDHLFLGTLDDNMKDAARKGRMKKRYNLGLIPHGGSLTLEDVRFIRANPDMCAGCLAKQFGVEYRAIVHVREGKTWKNVPQTP